MHMSRAVRPGYPRAPSHTGMRCDIPSARMPRRCCKLTSVHVYGPEGARLVRDVRAGHRLFTAVDGRLQVHTVTAVSCERKVAIQVRTRNRTVIAAGHRSLLVLRATTGRVVHREDADWLGVPQGRMPYGSRSGT